MPPLGPIDQYRNPEHIALDVEVQDTYRILKEKLVDVVSLGFRDDLTDGTYTSPAIEYEVEGLNEGKFVQAYVYGELRPGDRQPHRAFLATRIVTRISDNEVMPVADEEVHLYNTNGRGQSLVRGDLELHQQFQKDAAKTLNLIQSRILQDQLQETRENQVNLSPEMDEVLDELCAARGLDKRTVLKRAGLILKYLDEQQQD